MQIVSLDASIMTQSCVFVSECAIHLHLKLVRGALLSIVLCQLAQQISNYLLVK